MSSPWYHFNVSGVGPRYLIFHWNERKFTIIHDSLIKYRHTYNRSALSGFVFNAYYLKVNAP